MITNSHSKWMYPDGLSSLACGGAWGCAIFFFCSGFTMANIKTDSFWKYALKRLIRIYPVIWIWYLITFSFQDDFTWKYMIWPKYWFIQAILYFYVLFYFVMKWGNRLIPLLIGICLAATLFLYINDDHSKWMIDLTYQKDHITWYYYFGIMLWGAFLRTKVDTSNKTSGKANIFLCAIIPLSFALCYGVKFVCMKNQSYVNFQILFPILLYLSCFTFSQLLSQLTLKRTIISKAISFIAERTLEIYIVQQLILLHCEKLGKPMGAVVAISTILILATVFHWFVSWAISKSNISKFYT